jgi:hypothetical protein
MVNRIQAGPLVSILLGGIWLAACGLPSDIPTQADPSESIEGTLSPAPTFTLTPELPTSTPVPSATSTATSTIEPTPTQTSSPTPLPFNVQGQVCYPSENIPPMTLFFEETNTSTLVELPTTENQTEYQVKLDPGLYIAYAWLLDFSRGGMYSRAVLCGLGTECTDHTVLPFTVNELELTEGIDICDWFAGPYNVPYPPGREPADITGTISGNLTYLNADIPELRVVAFNLDLGYWYWVNTLPGQNFYAINELLPGTYNIVAYDALGNSGGHAAGNHDLIDILVEPGKVFEGANINDWTAPPGTYPPDPTQ